MEDYKENSVDFVFYYNHQWTEYYKKSAFYFDGGYSFVEINLPQSPVPNFENYECAKLNKNFYSIVENQGFFPNIRNNPKEKYSINLRQANQGYSLLDSNYKILWSTKNPGRFHFTDKKIIWSNIRLSGIGSNDKEELLYLFSLLNSKTNFYLLKNLMKMDNEKDFLVSIKTIKEFIRTPKILSNNENIKKEIISLTNEIINMEKSTFSNLIDFKKSLLQKFDKIEVIENELLIGYKNFSEKWEILDKIELVKDVVENLKNYPLLDKNGTGNVSELISLSVFDKEYQYKLKNYIDDLVFSL